MAESKKFFSIRVQNNEIVMTVFDQDGPVSDPNNPDRTLDNTRWGTALHGGNFATAIKFALDLGAVPFTDDMAETYFSEG